jgi:O-antigen ligase
MTLGHEARRLVFASSRQVLVVGAYLGLALFLLDALIVGRVRGDLSLQALVDVLVAGGALLIGLWQLPNTYRLLTRPPALFLVLFALWALISTSYSVTPLYTLRMALMLAGLLLFAAAVARLLTPKLVLTTVVASLGVLILASWLVYFASPEYGRMEAWLQVGDEHHVVERMRGLTRNANVLGRLVALFLGALLLLYLYRYCRLQDVLIPAALGLVTLAYTQSRTSALALIAALVILALRRWPRLVPALAVVMLFGLGYFALAPPAAQLEMLESFSRMGQAQEILTLTGRTPLWAFVLEKIEEAPWLGHGYASSPMVISEYRTEQQKLSHAHNMMLQSVLTVGIVGTLPLLAVLAWQAIAFFKNPVPFRDLLFLLVALMGIVEAAALLPTPNALMLLWFVSVFWLGERDYAAHGSSGILAK